jgi:hypothetical protein
MRLTHECCTDRDGDATEDVPRHVVAKSAHQVAVEQGEGDSHGDVWQQSNTGFQSGITLGKLEVEGNVVSGSLCEISTEFLISRKD